MTSTETTSTGGRSGAELDDLAWWTRPVAERDALFARLRAQDPRPFVQERDLGGAARGGGFWALTRYADVWEVSRRPGDFCSGEGTTIFDQPRSLREYRGSIIDMDNPEHQRIRRIVSRGFTARSLERLRADVAASARDIIGSVAERGECDFVTEVAALLPLRIVNDMMGIPRSHERYIFDQTNVILGASDAEYVPDQTPRGVASAVWKAGEGLAQLLRELAAERIADPRDDLVSTLVAAQDENLSADELARFFILLVGAGNETTRNAIAHGLLALTQFPEQRTRWQDDPDTYTAAAVEEVVRWASPVLYMRRTVTADGVRLGDQVFAKGDKVVLWYRSANQDEDHFPDPTRFDITRDMSNAHVAYGAPGPHHCLGANLARLELSVTFRTLLEMLPDIRAVGEPDLLRSNFLHGIKHLRAEFTPARVAR